MKNVSPAPTLEPIVFRGGVQMIGDDQTARADFSIGNELRTVIEGFGDHLRFMLATPPSGHVTVRADSIGTFYDSDAGGAIVVSKGASRGNHVAASAASVQMAIDVIERRKKRQQDHAAELQERTLAAFASIGKATPDPTIGVNAPGFTPPGVPTKASDATGAEPGGTPIAQTLDGILRSLGISPVPGNAGSGPADAVRIVSQGVAAPGLDQPSLAVMLRDPDTQAEVKSATEIVSIVREDAKRQIVEMCKSMGIAARVSGSFFVLEIEPKAF